MFRRFRYKSFSYKIKVYKNDMLVSEHFIIENRYLKAILKVLNLQGLDAVIFDNYNNRYTLEKLLSQLEG